MESKAHAAGRHPIHPSLIAFPTALLPMMLILNLLYLWLDEPGLYTAGFWVGVVGIVSTIAAMIPGIIDMSAIPDGTKAHRTGVLHAITGTGVLVAYVASVWVRWPLDAPGNQFGIVLAIDIVGSLLIVVQGWLGGELVYRHHMGVLTEAEGAEPVTLEGKDSPSRRPARRSGPHGP